MPWTTNVLYYYYFIIVVVVVLTQDDSGAIVPGNVNSCSKAAMVYLEIIIGNTTMTDQTLQTYHQIDRADMETELCKKSHGKSTQA